MAEKPSVEGLRYLRSQGWTYKRIGDHYGLTEGEVYEMMRSAPVTREGEE